MTREEAITRLHWLKRELIKGTDMNEPIDMAIEALQFVEHFDLLKEYQSLQEVVKCEDCRHYIVERFTTRYGWCLENMHSVNEDDFCSMGERGKE